MEAPPWERVFIGPEIRTIAVGSNKALLLLKKKKKGGGGRRRWMRVGVAICEHNPMTFKSSYKKQPPPPPPPPPPLCKLQITKKVELISYKKRERLIEISLLPFSFLLRVLLSKVRQPRYVCFIFCNGGIILATTYIKYNKNFLNVLYILNLLVQRKKIK